MKKLLARFVREDSGQDIIEYGLLAGLITTGVVVVVGQVGDKVKLFFDNLKAELDK